MNDKQRLEQARKEYEEFLAKMFAYRISSFLPMDAQWDLSLSMIKLKKTLKSDFNQKKFLVTLQKRKGKS